MAATVPASRTTSLRRSSDADSILPDPPGDPGPSRPGPGAGPAPARRHLDRLLSDLRLPAHHRPHPGALRAARQLPALPGLPRRHLMRCPRAASSRRVDSEDSRSSSAFSMRLRTSLIISISLGSRRTNRRKFWVAKASPTCGRCETSPSRSPLPRRPGGRTGGRGSGVDATAASLEAVEGRSTNGAASIGTRRIWSMASKWCNTICCCCCFVSFPSLGS